MAKNECNTLRKVLKTLTKLVTHCKINYGIIEEFFPKSGPHPQQFKNVSWWSCHHNCHNLVTVGIRLLPLVLFLNIATKLSWLRKNFINSIDKDQLFSACRLLKKLQGCPQCHAISWIYYRSVKVFLLNEVCKMGENVNVLHNAKSCLRPRFPEKLVS